MEIQIYESGRYYGTLGENTDVGDLHVGDILKVYADRKTFYKMVVWDEHNKHYSVLGFLFSSLKNLENHYTYEKAVPYELINNINLTEVTGFDFKLKDGKKRMTKSQIEEVLGYEIEIIG